MAAIEMPPYISARSFDMAYVQQLSPTGESGFIQTLDRTSPFWAAQYTTPGLSEDRWQQWINFFDQLEGSRNTFLAYDPRRPMPYAYRTQAITNNPWGSLNVTGADYTNSTLSFSGATANAVYTTGDYVSFLTGGIWYLFRLQASGLFTGGTATIPVKMRPNLISPSFPVACRYRQACAEMKMIGRPTESDSVDGLPSFTFRAGQYIARVPS